MRAGFMRQLWERDMLSDEVRELLSESANEGL
jgi:hypothetical protein